MKTKSLRATVAIVALIVLIITLITAGTLALVNSNQGKATELGNSPTPGATTHDDFDAPNKDVYVENWGTESIFVRIRLDEYMELGDGAGNKTASGLANNATPVIAGSDINGPKTWQPHIPVGTASVCKEDFHKYWDWQMGGQKYYMPADPALRDDPTYVAQDTQAYNGSEPDVKKTQDAKIMTMDQWIKSGTQVGPYWVVDTDGWAYWAQALTPGEATGLLLDAVDLVHTPDEAYYYAINVIAQMGTKTGDKNYHDFGDATSTDPDSHMTQEGLDLLNKAANNNTGALINGVAITSAQGFAFDDKIYVAQGTSMGLSASVDAASGANTNVKWVTNDATDGSKGFRFTNNGDTATLQVADSAAVGSSFTVLAVSLEDESKIDIKTVIVIDKDAKGVVKGDDKKLYVDYDDNTFKMMNDNGTTLGDLICGGADLIPGNRDDRNNITVASDGTKYLGPNADESYQKKGPDNKLGTSDDIFVWQLDSTKPIAPGNEVSTHGLAGRVAQTPLYGTISIDGHDWIVAAKDGDYALLLVADDSFGMTNYHASLIAPDYNSSKLRDSLNAAYATMNEMKTIAVPTNLVGNGAKKPHDTSATSVHGTALAGSNETDVFFALSKQDMTNLTNDKPATFAKLTVNKDGWWLRTASTGAFVYYCKPTATSLAVVTVDNVLTPAVWVKTN